MIAGIAESLIPKGPDDLLGPALMARLDRLDMLSRKLLSGTMPGERRSKRRGRSVEFDDFRSYVPGDDLRHIDWNIYARLDKLIIKLFRAEEDLALNILVDTSRSMDVGAPGKLLYSLQLAFALAYIGLVNQNRVSVATFAPQRRADQPVLSRLSPRRGRGGVHEIGTHLIEAMKRARQDAPAGSVNPAAAFNQAMRVFSESIGSRGVSIVLSDYLSPQSIEPGLASLAARTMAGDTDTWCVQVLSPQELDPESARGQGFVGDVRLTDVESQDASEVTVTPEIIAKYRERFDAAREQLSHQCAAKGIAYLMVPTNTDLTELMTETVRRRGLVG
jgi:uncharacterized protein (DUF58 family)